eukprot:scaffold158370_cov62-Attheya_sp.AAC.1
MKIYSFVAAALAIYGVAAIPTKDASITSDPETVQERLDQDAAIPTKDASITVDPEAVKKHLELATKAHNKALKEQGHHQTTVKEHNHAVKWATLPNLKAKLGFETHTILNNDLDTTKNLHLRHAADPKSQEAAKKHLELATKEHNKALKEQGHHQTTVKEHNHADKWAIIPNLKAKLGFERNTILNNDLDATNNLHLRHVVDPESQEAAKKHLELATKEHNKALKENGHHQTAVKEHEGTVKWATLPNLKSGNRASPVGGFKKRTILNDLAATKNLNLRHVVDPSSWEAVKKHQDQAIKEHNLALKGHRQTVKEHKNRAVKSGTPASPVGGFDRHTILDDHAATNNVHLRDVVDPESREAIQKHLDNAVKEHDQALKAHGQAIKGHNNLAPITNGTRALLFVTGPADEEKSEENKIDELF